MKAKANIPNQEGTQKRRQSATSSAELAARAAFYKFFNRPGGAVDLLFLAVGIIGNLASAAKMGSVKAARSLSGLSGICRDLDVKRGHKHDVAGELCHDDKSEEAFAMTMVAILGRLIQEVDKGSKNAEKALWALSSVCQAVGRNLPSPSKKRL